MADRLSAAFAAALTLGAGGSWTAPEHQSKQAPVPEVEHASPAHGTFTNVHAGALLVLSMLEEALEFDIFDPRVAALNVLATHYDVAQAAWQPSHEADAGEVDWLPKAWVKIDRLAQLGQDWNSYGAQPPSALTVELAKRAAELFHESARRPKKLIAMADGGISIRLREASRRVRIELYNSGEIVLALSHNAAAEDYEMFSTIDDAVVFGDTYLGMPLEA